MGLPKNSEFKGSERYPLQRFKGGLNHSTFCTTIWAFLMSRHVCSYSETAHVQLICVTLIMVALCPVS